MTSAVLSSSKATPLASSLLLSFLPGSSRYNFASRTNSSFRLMWLVARMCDLSLILGSRYGLNNFPVRRRARADRGRKANKKEIANGRNWAERFQYFLSHRSKLAVSGAFRYDH